MKSNNSNLLLAVAVLIGFFFVWESFIVKRYAPKPSETKSMPTATVGKPGAASTPAPSAPIPAANLADIKDATAMLTADGNEIVFTSRGAAVTSWKIQERDAWLELVLPKEMRSHSPLETFPELNYKIVKKSEREIQFIGQLPSGIIVQKSLTLGSRPPFHKLDLTFKNTTTSEQALETELGWGEGIGKGPEEAATAEMRAIALAGEQVRAWTPGLIFNRDMNRTDAGPFKWIGIDNHHFLAVLVGDISHAHMIVNRKSAPYVATPLQINLKPGESRTLSYNLFVGPKAYSSLLKTDFELWRAVDFGFFGIIAKALLRSLAFFHNLTGNYGWAIILLTLCIQILVLPLTKKSLQHTVKMKEIQPHLKKIQEQFKSDPKRLQVETMNFYRKNGMKLMGMEGCLPILLQIPIFIAFYTTLNAAYELRGAPWILWIHDLGVHDPYYVLPILMGLGMFLQQKATAAPAADPAQAKMMMFMPVIMTVMFIKLPAGLVLYWVVNSMITIIIQLIMMKTMTRHQAVV